jgi:HEAT repeat protein
MGCNTELDLIYEVLIEALKDGGCFTREEAAYGLGEIGDQRSLKILKEIELKDDDENVRKRARNAIKKLNP